MLKLYKDNNSETQLQRVADILKSGGVIVMPTDSCYKLACGALNVSAVERIYKLKGEDVNRMRLSIICYSISQISEYVKLETWVFKLLKTQLPGSYTFILPALKRLPKIFKVKNKREVGVRMPDNQLVEDIVKKFGEPILVASIPLRGQDEEMVLYPEWIEETLGKEVDLIIDAGKGKEGYSTVIDCTGKEPQMIRKGV